jgi:hypothetical protein
MKKKILGFGILLLSSSMLLAQQVLYEEHFTAGQASLKWNPGYSGDSMVVVNIAVNPSGDGWVGSLGCVKSGGGVGLTFAGSWTLKNYSLEAQILTKVQATSGGSYNGLVAYYDTTGGNKFYSLLADFDSDQRIRLRAHLSASSITVIRDWKQSAGEIPGGIPTQNSWHKMKLTVGDRKIWAYFNDTLLTGCPFTDTTLKAGFFGIYSFNMTDTSAKTLCDDIIVKSVSTSVREELQSTVPNTFALSQNYPNPFNPETNINYTLPQAGPVRLEVFNSVGGHIQTLVDGYRSAGTYTVHVDASQLPSGVYFYQLRSGALSETLKMTLMK